MKASINRLLKPLRREPRLADARAYWPEVRTERIHHPFLFLLSPPGSGATAIARYLSQRADIGALHPSYEGQRLVRGLMDADRWFPGKFVDVPAVLGAWNRRIAEVERTRAHAFFLEKSPPNLVRYEQFVARFADARVVVSNRAPTANIDAQLRRHANPAYQGAPREEVMRHLARLWIWRSRLLRKAVEKNGFPLLTYEAFREDPERAVTAFGIEADAGAPAADVGDEHAGRGMGGQVMLLSTRERRIIAEVLATEPDVLAFFGYERELEGRLADSIPVS